MFKIAVGRKKIMWGISYFKLTTTFVYTNRHVCVFIHFMDDHAAQKYKV